jgi:HAD superfamily hydrolase (TIGR01509 family)
VDFKLTKNILFDFGAVVINIDIPQAYRAFSDLSGIPAETIQHLFEGQGAYADFESGKMSNDGFRALLRQELSISSSDEQLDNAWNSMLLDIPPVRIEKLRDLKTRYNIYLLSNTNAIHKKKIQEMFLEQFGIEDFTKLFHKRYLSYEIGLLKPDPSIYEYVLKDAGLKKEETIFLDDNTDNVKSALNIGLPTIQVLPGEYTMMEILKNA